MCVTGRFCSGAGTSESCRITGIDTKYCSIEWTHDMDFCESTSSASDLAKWGHTINDTTELQSGAIVHGKCMVTPISL